MDAPDRVRIEFMDSFADMAKSRVSDADVWMEDSGSDHLPQYLRATPALLALIEAAKTCREGNAGWWNRANKVMAAALAFAKSQDHPDAG